MKISVKTLIYASVVCLLSFRLAAQSHFKGLNSYFNDSLLLKQVKEKRIKCVSESVNNGSGIFYNGHFCFDERGRRTDYVRSYGRGYTRYSNEYTSQNLISRETHYSEQDSSKVEYWLRFVYDAKGRREKEYAGSNSEGKVAEALQKETKILYETNNVIRKATYEYNYHSDEPEYSIDSVSGIYVFHISYHFSNKDADQKGRKKGEKKLTSLTRKMAFFLKTTSTKNSSVNSKQRRILILIIMSMIPGDDDRVR